MNMASQFYCRTPQGEFGPYSSAELNQFCREQRLLPEHHVRQGAEGRWVLAGQIPGLFPTGAPPAQPTVAQPPVAVATPVSVTPVSPTSAVPMGVAVGSVPAGVPVAPVYASPVAAPAVPAGFPVIVTSQPAAPQPGSEQKPVRRSKDQTALYVTVGLAVCLVLLVGVGAAYGLGLFNFKSSQKVIAASDEGSQEESADTDSESEPDADKDAGTERKSQAPPPKSEPPAKPDQQGKPTKAQEKIIYEVTANRGWLDTSSVKSVTSGSVKIMIAAAWFSGEPASNSPAPSKDSSEDEAASPKASPKPRYVCIEVSLENAKGPGVVGYKSWNGAGKKPEETTALLLDSEGRICPLVSREKAPEAGRRRVEELALGQTISDVLVFEAPAGDFDYLRIALPYAALGRTGAVGFHVPRDKVALKKADLAAAAPSSPKPAAGGAKPAAGGAGEQPETIDERASLNKPDTKKPADSDAPPSPKELEKQIQDAKKLEAQRKAEEEKAAKDKAGENKEP